MTPTHTRRSGKLYRYYVSTDVLKRVADACPIRRVPAGEIEGAVIDQLRGLLRAPEIIVRTWAQGAETAGDMHRGRSPRTPCSGSIRLWDELFPAEQARIVRLLVERVDVGQRAPISACGPRASQSVRRPPRSRSSKGRLMPYAEASSVLGATNKRLLSVDAVTEKARPSQPTGKARERSNTPQSTLTVHIPMRLHKRGGRKRIELPAGARPDNPGSSKATDATLLRALARAHRWQHLLETGQYRSVTELARAEKMSETYLGRVLRLTLLAPAIVEKIANGPADPSLSMEAALKPFLPLWKSQMTSFGRG